MQPREGGAGQRVARRQGAAGARSAQELNAPGLLTVCPPSWLSATCPRRRPRNTVARGLETLSWHAAAGAGRSGPSHPATLRFMRQTGRPTGHANIAPGPRAGREHLLRFHRWFWIIFIASDRHPQHLFENPHARGARPPEATPPVKTSYQESRSPPVRSATASECAGGRGSAGTHAACASSGRRGRRQRPPAPRAAPAARRTRQLRHDAARRGRRGAWGARVNGSARSRCVRAGWPPLAGI